MLDCNYTCDISTAFLHAPLTERTDETTKRILSNWKLLVVFETSHVLVEAGARTVADTLCQGDD